MPPKEEKKSEKTDSKKDEKKEPKQDEGLFLLEVLVDKIVFERSPCFTDKDFRTCVTVECSAIDPIEICDDDGFSNKSAGPFEKNFNSGRSVLFSLKEKAIEDAMNKFVVNVTIHKSLPCDCHQDTKIEMGKAEIDLTKEFVQARTKFLESPTGVSFEALKDAFRLTDPEGNESGDIAMFLRISCFGKLITTRFQGASSAPPNLGVGESSGNLDRSCDPKKEFQTFEDPCSCGTRGGGGGSAVAAKMPCPEADDPCCCSGPKPPPKDPMACRNTDPYCLHIPKGALPRLPYCKILTEEQKMELRERSKEVKQRHHNNTTCLKNNSCDSRHDMINDSIKPSSYVWSSQNLPFLDSTYSEKNSVDCSFGQKETAVFMTLFSKCNRRTSATQATASINKCLQVRCDNKFDRYIPSYTDTSCALTTYTSYGSHLSSSNRESEVYFFGRKNNTSGMGKQMKNKKGNEKDPPKGTERPADTAHTSSQTKTNNPSSGGASKPPADKQTKGDQSKGQDAKKGDDNKGTSGQGEKKVSIKDEKKSCTRKTCPFKDISSKSKDKKDDMAATLTHIKIGPKDICPIGNDELCVGEKCVNQFNKNKEAVKISATNNPRRGVFEIVIRRSAGGPLGKNELMLEWTPPPRAAPAACGWPIPVRMPNYKMIVCRNSPSCKGSKRSPCKRYRCSPPCRGCRKSCPPPCFRPCPPPKCKQTCPPLNYKPCGAPCAGPGCVFSPCRIPCKSSPCLRPCPVGYRRPRKIRSQPKIKPHKIRISPCCNRSKVCPVVRCRSVLGPCIQCCNPPSCPIRPRCCKSSTSTCC